MSSHETRGSGLLLFAIVMIGVAGLFNVLDGIVALSRSSFYISGVTYVYGDLRTWGWTVLIIGILQIIASMALIGGSQIARWFAIVIAVLSAISQLGFVPAYPFWALALFAVDIIVIYALTVYGGRPLDVV